MSSKRNPEGIRVRHRKSCRTLSGGDCNCRPAYEASVFSKRDGKKIRRTFANLSEAKLWRADAKTALAKGVIRASRPTTVRQAWEQWRAAAEVGTVRNRSGERYKPSSLRNYDLAMRSRVLPQFGSVKLTDLTRGDLQDFVERLLESGLSPSSVGTTLLPLRAIYRRAMARGEVAVNPCSGLQLPAVRGRRERIADPTEAAHLIAAVPEEDRVIWMTAMYAGLRRGELRALRWEDVDLAEGVIRVERNWDPQAGVIELKSRAGRRRVPIIGELRDALIDHRVNAESTEGLIFGQTPDKPFNGHSAQRRADAAWEEADLERITPHECRHTFASLMIAAGVNAKALSTFMGHANISITLDRYGHLMPGSEAEAGALLGSYLAAQRKQAEDQAREAETVAT